MAFIVGNHQICPCQNHVLCLAFNQFQIFVLKKIRQPHTTLSVIFLSFLYQKKVKMCILDVILVD